MSRLEAVVRSLCEVVINYCEIQSGKKYPIEQSLNLPHSEFIVKLQTILKEAPNTNIRNPLFKYLEFEIRNLKPIIDQSSWSEEESLKVHQHLYYLINNIIHLLNDHQKINTTVELANTEFKIPGLLTGGPLKAQKLSKSGQLLLEKVLTPLGLSETSSNEIVGTCMKELMQEHRSICEQNKKNNEILEEYPNLKPNIESLNKQLEAAKKINISLENEKNLLQNETCKLKDNSKILQEKINGLKSNSSSLKDENFETNKTVKLLEEKNTELTRQLAIKEAQVQQLSKEIDRLNKQRNLNSKQIESLTDINKKISPLEKENGDLKISLHTFDTQTQKLSEEVKEKQAEILELKKLNNQITLMENTNRDLQEKNQQLEIIIQAFNKQIQEKDIQLKDLTQQHEKELHEYKKQIETTNVQIQQGLVDKGNIQQQLEEKLQESKQSLKQSQNQVQQLQENFQKQKKQLDQNHLQINEDSNEIKFLEEQLTALKAYVVDLEEKNSELSELSKELQTNSLAKKDLLNETDNPNNSQKAPRENQQSSFAKRFSFYFMQNPLQLQSILAKATSSPSQNHNKENSQSDGPTFY